MSNDPALDFPVVDGLSFEAEAELATLQENLPEELRHRVGDRFRHVMGRATERHQTEMRTVWERLAKKRGYSSLSAFERALDAMLARQTIERSIPAAQRSHSPQLEAIYNRINQILGDFQTAQVAIDVLREGDVRESLDYSVSVEETLLRAERAGQLDKLTGLFNDRDAVTRRFEIERRHFLEQGKEDEVMLWVEIDLDDFKQLNSKLKHANVDQYMLRPLAERLKNRMRDSDLLCRFGGDEFSVIMNKVKKSEIEKVLDKIQALIKEPFATPSGEIVVTASIGGLVIERPEAVVIDTTTTDAFMGDVRHRADVAADFAKHSGKDQWKIYSVDLKEFELSEEVFVKSQLRNQAGNLQLLRDVDNYALADALEEDTRASAKRFYPALRDARAKQLAKAV